MKSIRKNEMYTTSNYLEKNPTWHTEDSIYKAKQILKIIKRNNLQPNSITDIGCGAGEVLHQLSIQMNSNDISFVGYEISPDAFELCQQIKRNGLQYKFGNFFDDNSTIYDIILAMDVVEHIEDYLGFLRDLNKYGKYKIFNFPLDMNVLDTFRNSQLRYRKQYGHIHYFSKDTVLEALQESGCEIIDYFYVPGGNVMSCKTITSCLLKLPRILGFKINKDLTVRTFGGFSLMVLAK